MAAKNTNQATTPAASRWGVDTKFDVSIFLHNPMFTEARCIQYINWKGEDIERFRDTVFARGFVYQEKDGKAELISPYNIQQIIIQPSKK